MHARLTQVLSLAMIVIGVALIARLSLAGAILGLLFVAAGGGRLFVAARLRRTRA